MGVELVRDANETLRLAREIHGSGEAYASDFERVLAAVSAANTDDLPAASRRREIMQECTDQVVASVLELKDTLKTELALLRREIALNGGPPAA